MRRILPTLGKGRAAVAVLALVLVTATAAGGAVKTLITGSQVKDGSLTSADIANGTLKAADLSPLLLKQFKGERGAAGPQGEQGPQGDAGTDGTDGRDGTDGTDGKDGLDGTDGVDGIDGKDGIDGTNGVSGYAVVTHVSASVAASANGSDTAACPTGKSPIGGGLSSTPTAFTLENSYPNGSGWTVTAQNTGATDATFTVYAVCALTS